MNNNPEVELVHDSDPKVVEEIKLSILLRNEEFSLPLINIGRKSPKQCQLELKDKPIPEDRNAFIESLKNERVDHKPRKNPHVIMGGGTKSPEERKAMLDVLTAEERNEFLKDKEILERINKNFEPISTKAYSMEEVMTKFGITQKDLDETPEPEQGEKQPMKAV